MPTGGRESGARPGDWAAEKSAISASTKAGSTGTSEVGKLAERHHFVDGQTEA